ncbi:MAG: folate family ECF transporter S component [Lachnospiraceae bacterium]|nr:folate family ECF transporter S component [Lachnospiraceae bacterium]
MKIRTSQLTIDAMLAAMCAVLGYVALDAGQFKITFESLPVLFAALMYGPVDGMLVGGIGTFIYQFLRYGFSATTALWILPYIVCGLVAGLYSKHFTFNNNRKQLLFIVVLSELLIFVFNTLAIYVDSKVYGYYSYAYVWGAIGLRFVIAVIKSVIFGLVTPGILKRMSRITHNGGR